MSDGETRQAQQIAQSARLLEKADFASLEARIVAAELMKRSRKAKARYIVTTHSYMRHRTAAGAIAERNRLRREVPDRAEDFRVLTVIDEPNTEKLERERELPRWRRVFDAMFR